MLLSKMRSATASPLILVKASPVPELLTTRLALNTTNGTADVVLPPYWNYTERVIFATLLGIIMLIAIVGNILVITVVAKNRGMRTRTNLFLCNLAVADLFCATLDMPISLATIIKGDWIFSRSVCQFNGFALPFFFVAAIHTLMYIGIHKYLSIRYPLGQFLTRTRVRLMMGAAWVWATIAGYLTIHGLNTVTYKPRTTQCGPAYPNNVWTYTHLTFIVLTCYIVPLIILTICYIGMFHEIKALSIRMEQHTTMEKELIYVQQRRITLTLFIVLVFFVICWTPYIIYSIWVSFVENKDTMSRFANPISYWCGYLSSACNPLIYGLMSPAFREGYKELMCHVGQEEIVSDGYSYYRRKKRPWSTISVSSNYYSKAYQPPGPQPFTQFRNFLQQHLGGLFSEHDSTFGSAPASRKNSFSSITNFVLFPKSRTVSTNSLPRNFSYSASLPVRFRSPRNNLHNTLITRLNHVLNPNCPKKSEHIHFEHPSPVYYPKLNPHRKFKKHDIEIHIDPVDDVTGNNSNRPMGVQTTNYVNEIAPLLIAPNNNDDNVLLPKIVKPDLLTVTVDLEPKPEVTLPTPRSSVSSCHHRNSIESGYNEDVFLNANSGLTPRRVSQPPPSTRRDSLFGDMLTVPEETRHWFSKSLSEEGKKTPSDDLSIDKATSDTCILCKKEKKQAPQKPEVSKTHLGIFRRLFSRTSSSSDGESRKRRHPKDSISSVEDSPSTERKVSSGILKKYFRSVSADPTRTPQEGKPSDGRHLSFGTEHYIPHRSASDPSLLDRKQSKWKRIKNKYSIRRKNKRKFSSDDGKSDRSESSSFGRLIRGISERPPPLEKHPSIEKLDTMNQESLYMSYAGLAWKSSNYVNKKKLMDRRSVSHEVVKGSGDNPKALDTEVVLQDANDPKVAVYLYRSASDPNMTFQMIHDKVVQQRETKKWDRERRVSHRRISVAPLASDSTDDTAIEIDDCDQNVNNSNNLSVKIQQLFGKYSGDVSNSPKTTTIPFLVLPNNWHQNPNQLGKSISDEAFHPETISHQAKNAHSIENNDPFKRWTFNGYYACGEGVERETAL